MRTLLDFLVNIMFNIHHDPGVKERIINSTLDILDPQVFSFERRDFGELLSAIHGPGNDEAQIPPNIKQFLARFCKCESKRSPSSF